MKFGYSLAAPGDVNGDGIGDLVIGGPFGQMDKGQVRIHSGANGLILYVENGTNTNEQLGLRLAYVGDVNSDGRADYLSGTMNRVRVISGPTGQVLAEHTSASTTYGNAVRGVGDLDLDGVPDYAIGDPSYYPGFGMTGVIEVRSGNTGTVIKSILPTGSFGGWFGLRFESMDDVSGDGIPDLLAASYSNSTVGVISGSDGVAVSATLPSHTEAFGVLGRIDEDGIQDFARIPYSGSGMTIMSVAGTPFGSQVFGTGCAGSLGAVPSISAGVGSPTSTVGNPYFGMFLSNTPPGKTALMLYGVSFQSWLGQGLPFDLSFLGAPGCALWVSPDFINITTTYDAGNGHGQGFRSLPIPANPTLGGAVLHFQWYVLDPGPLPFPGTMSEAMQLLIL